MSYNEILMTSFRFPKVEARAREARQNYLVPEQWISLIDMLLSRGARNEEARVEPLTRDRLAKDH